MKRKLIIFLINFLLLTNLYGCQLFNKEPKIAIDQNFVFEYNVYSKEPNWLSAISVEDKEDGKIDLSQVVIDKDVNMNEVGEYFVSYQVKDSKGKSSEKRITVKVVDNEKPVIHLKGDEEITVLLGFPYVDPGVNVTDNYDLDLTNYVNIDDTEVNTEKIGKYTVTYEVSDSNGNHADIETRIVNVVDDLSILISDEIEEAIRFYLQMPTGKITKADSESVFELTINNKGLTSLSGIEYLPNLTNLTIINNEISDLTQLKFLTNLKSLNFSNNQISDINIIGKLPNLEKLYLSNNRITDLNPIKNLTQLKYLHLSNNKIIDISDLSQLKQLVGLKLDNNLIRDIKILRNLHQNGAFNIKEAYIDIMNNPIETESNTASYQTIIYFLDHGFNVEHTYILDTSYYEEDHNDFIRLDLGKRQECYMGFSNDVDWYMFVLDGSATMEILYSRSDILNVQLYAYNKELSEISVTKENTIKDSIITENLDSGIYYIKVSLTTSNSTPGTYFLEVRKQANSH